MDAVFIADSVASAVDVHVGDRDYAPLHVNDLSSYLAKKCRPSQAQATSMPTRPVLVRMMRVITWLKVGTGARPVRPAIFMPTSAASRTRKPVTVTSWLFIAP